MSLDGSFSCDAALRRLLARFPVLRSDARLLNLEEKGGDVTKGDIVEAIAEPFLHPSYTIPIMGCFRPLSRTIVERAVAKLRTVPSLESESSGCEEAGEDDVHVIDFYVGKGRGLRLHELASLALCRAMDLAPFLLSYILTYFTFSPPPFRRLLLITRMPLQYTEKDLPTLLEGLRVCYRFLLMEPNAFSGLWDWSCFLDFVQLSGNLYSGDARMSLDSKLDLRWCGIQILWVVLRMSHTTTKNLGLGEDEALECLLRFEEFCQDTSLEKAGWYIETANMKSERQDAAINFDNLLESFSNISSPLLPTDSNQAVSDKRDCRIRKSCSKESVRSPFILTSTVKKSFEMIFLAVSQRWPVLLLGPVGAGKTALINKVAQITRKQVLFIHVDEQMDCKTLVGSYVCTEVPGEFRWQPGSLTQAIMKGIWVVFEDIDKAPNEVRSVLLPLIEGSSSFVTGHGEAMSVPESFCLFATISTSRHEAGHLIEGNALWRKVMIGAPSKQDFLETVDACYPSLKPLCSKLVDTFEQVNSLVSHQFGGIGVGVVASGGAFSRFTLRDLLKWCRRIEALDLQYHGIGLSPFDWKRIYEEAVDVFAASTSSSENRLSIMRVIAFSLGVPTSEADDPAYKPIFQSLPSALQIGRITLHCSQTPILDQKRAFVGMRHSLRVLERIACSIKYKEPVLLVGETGTGKTTLVQIMAQRLGQALTVVNLNQQSDVADLLGGFKPTDARSICIPLYREFRKLFHKSFSEKDNEALLHRCETYAIEKNWKKLLHACQKPVEVVRKLCGQISNSGCGSKRKRPLSEEILQGWESFALRLDSARKQIAASAGMSFSYVEGAFITALKNGHWVLLDEVNLAPPEVLQRIVGVLDGESGTLCLTERGDIHYIERHPDFRIFACMNPATDAGKRELPYSFRSRFTEYFVDDVLDDEDLTYFVGHHMGTCNPTEEKVSGVVQFYKAAKRASEERLQDGANQKPQFSLRSLARALEYTKKAKKDFGFQKALYDGFCMFFLNLLGGPSAKLMDTMICSYLLGGVAPPRVSFDVYFAKQSGSQDTSKNDHFMARYVLTASVKEHLKNLARAVYIKRYPVLLQGPTSSGKTSLVHYLASVTGHEFVRINNHEHTDLQEYFGAYITDSHGKLQFQEGVLVKAVRKGHWIVLDELNLAPSDVLEALNRLLDDNRELFVPELQETVCAHPNFMLFATQNPPTVYGGRKVLSRAFRNRFLEIHVDEIPENELTTILENRCEIPGSYAVKMVEVMKELQLHRQNSKIFAGKHGFITPRDLFRWANRWANRCRMFGNSCEDLAKEGYLLLAERLREESEKSVVKETLERCLRVKLILNELYNVESGLDAADSDLLKPTGELESLGNIIQTTSMRRLFSLVEHCYNMREPVLLVGDTGGGKTTVCQLLNHKLKSKLHSLNCHQYTETSDFIGGFHPVRDRSRLLMEYKQQVELLQQSKFHRDFSGDVLSSDIAQAPLTLSQLNRIQSRVEQNVALHAAIADQDLVAFKKGLQNLKLLHNKWCTIFLWQDGPLVQAMKKGELFLVDEISLADDSVLERLNSVLEPERKLLLAEKGGSVPETITAHKDFSILATMNPGGDYGKKELSPALRNRFTEIWVPAVIDLDELRSIAIARFTKSELSCFADIMLKFWEWFNELQTGRVLTVRDLLSWVSFINATEETLGPEYAFIHGAFLVLLDGLSLGTSLSKIDANELRESCLSFLVHELKATCGSHVNSRISGMENYGWGNHVISSDLSSSDNLHSQYLFGIKPFYISKGHNKCKNEGFEFLAPTTRRNALRVLRAMQLPKPVLLEGSPGVGKTSLVVALAEYSGHTVVRINLSEQTDMMDLLGSDLPTQGEKGMEFSWSDGILLQALKNGSWVLLDELNLAPQSVLEGLNSILDHRAEVYIPELGLTFKCPPSFRIFACQNPSSQGGGRKGLPKSFLNRFVKVYVDELVSDDYLFICQSRHPSIPTALLSKLIMFNNRIYEDTMLHHKYGQDGSPWEFNLRDILRSCQIIEGAPDKKKFDKFLSIVYLPRMRTDADRREVLKLYETVFEIKHVIIQSPKVWINPQYLHVDGASIQRRHFHPTKLSRSQLNILPGIRHILEAAVHCVQYRWLCILVGPYSSGKTSVVRLLAHLTGNALHELNLSSGTDVSEILGCFEQHDFFRTCKIVISQVERYIHEFCSVQIDSSRKDLVHERESLFAKWFAFSSSVPSFNSEDSWKSGSCSLCLLIEIMEQLKYGLGKYQVPVSWSHYDLDKLLKIIQGLQQQKEMQPSAKFEWISGDLIKAVESGEWVVLDNANLCSPTILDRINSLAELDGSITINECGLVDGKPVKINAHPNFRMFITVDPKYGEISRAMRNRGVEIFMMQPNWLLTESSHDCKDGDMYDVKRHLILSGIPSNKLLTAMSVAHKFARDAGMQLGTRITLLEVTRWVELFKQLLMNGNQPTWSLQLSWEHTYLSSLGEVEGRDVIERVKDTYLSDIQILDPVSGPALTLPGGWPSPHSLMKFLSYPKEACVKQNCMYLEFLGAHCASYEASISRDRTFTLSRHREVRPSVIPDQGKYAKYEEFNFSVNNQKLLMAANWAIEQATDGDLALYITWFKWFGTQLELFRHPFKSFIKFLLSTFKEEIDHPIWKCILKCWREIYTHLRLDIDVQHIPLLSLRSLELACSDGAHEKCWKLLDTAIQCVKLLRLTLKQRDDEESYVTVDGTLQSLLLPILEALRCLEMEVLKVLFDSRELFATYSNLLDNHILFWKGVITSHYECLFVAWSGLKKEVLKLQPRFPEPVSALLVESSNIRKVPMWNFHMEKPALWVYGGHPFLPSSAAAYSSMQRLLQLCQSIWPRENVYALAGHRIDAYILSASTTLRYLAMQGVCMLLCVTANGKQDDAEIVNQLEKLFQSLGSMQKANIPSLSSTISCCFLSYESLSTRAGFDCWMATLPLFDKKSFTLDIFVLQALTRCSLEEAADVHQALSSMSDLLRYALDYSLRFSSRPPIDFSPYQTILWMVDAWNSVDSADHAKIPSFVLQMWFNWHSSLWSNYFEQYTMDSWSISDISCHLKGLTASATLIKIFQGDCPVKDYDIHSLKLRVTSRYLWENAPVCGDSICFLRSAAESLFKQIIFAHKKYFGNDVYEKIKSFFTQPMENDTLQDKLQSIRSLISSSSHGRLTSLVDSLIEPLLKELYFECSSSNDTDYLYNLGCAWTHIGALRFHLLLNPDGPDPVTKYDIRHSQLLEKISSLELENEVRQECERLAGQILSGDDQTQRSELLKKLQRESKRLQAKIVFRPEPAKYKNLRSACTDYIEFVSSCMKLVKNLSCSGNRTVIFSEAQNWQVTSASFINSISGKYPEYVDIIQPILVAVYEMKLGLSVAASSALEGDLLGKFWSTNTEGFLAAMHSLLKFPKCLPNREHPVELTDIAANFVECHLTSVSTEEETDGLKQLIAVLSKISAEKISAGKLQATIEQSVLINLANYVWSSLIIDNATFQILKKRFDHFASLWMDMKSHVKSKEENEARYYKFKPRSVRIEDILEGDLALSSSDSDRDLTLEDEEKLMEQAFSELKLPIENDDNVKEEWGDIPESVLDSIVLVHNQLFGSADLVECPGRSHITEGQRLESFMELYKLLSSIIQGLQPLQAARLEDKLMPEHLLHICLEYKETLGLHSQSTHAYNFYKDPNASVMSTMVKPLASILERVRSLLHEWPEHPGLQNILDITEKLLAIPLTTPLSKVLLGLNILVARTRSLEECASRFSFSEQMKPIWNLMSLWQRLELECWPVLLDVTQAQYELNAGKLWFPLWSVLHRNLQGDAGTENIVEEFIQTASVGEFKKRLQLLVAFHEQIKHGLCLKAYSSDMRGNLDILYNMFGYYGQFVPAVSKHIEDARKCIEKDLKEHMKLFHWGLSDNYSSIQIFRKTRQKIWKLIQKFNDILQQPVMVILNPERTILKDNVVAWFEEISDERNVDLSHSPDDILQLSNAERFLWCNEWENKAVSALKSISSRSSDYLLGGIVTDGLTCQDHKRIWDEVWASLEKICRNATGFAYTWKQKTKNLKKRRALGELLKILECCGLSKHRSTALESESGLDQQIGVFHKPSYDIRHLLQRESSIFIGKSRSSVNLPDTTEKYVTDSTASKWEHANKYYFQSLAMVQRICQIRLNFHKDLTLEQVNRAASFLDHLVDIQQEQRKAAYGASEQLKKLRQIFHLLGDIRVDVYQSDQYDQTSTGQKLIDKSSAVGVGCKFVVIRNQHAVLKCMWQQKHLFDSLLAMSKDVLLLLGRVKSCHLSTCDTVGVEADMLYSSIDKFIDIFEKAKGSLDKYLLAEEGIVNMSAAVIPFIVSKQMEEVVTLNFEVIATFEEGIHKLEIQQSSIWSIKITLLNCFRDLIQKGKKMMNDFHVELKASDQGFFSTETFATLNATYCETFGETNRLLLDVLGKINGLDKGPNFVEESSFGNITSWTVLLQSYIPHLQKDNLYDCVLRTIIAARELANTANNEELKVSSQILGELKQLSMLLDLILTFGEGILLEFLDVHKTTAEMTYVLSHIFLRLFSEGFGDAEEPKENISGDGSKESAGTGMGEGEGINDVSDQIDDESQLLGTSEKQDGLDNSGKAPSTKDKGVEMDEDFTADTFSLSEDSEGENLEDGEETNLESMMGEAAEGSQVVDEKQWDENEDGDRDNDVEKYESGPSVKETNSSSRELRAKEDDASVADKPEERDDNESDRFNEKDHEPDVPDTDDYGGTDDMMLDKKEAFEDPTGTQFNEQEDNLLDGNPDETQGPDLMEDDDSSPHASDEEMRDEDETSGPTDHVDHEDSILPEDSTKNGEMKSTDSHAGSFDSDMVEPFDDRKGADSAVPLNAAQSASTAMEPEVHWSKGRANDDLISASNVPCDDAIGSEPATLDASNGSRLNSDQSKSRSAQDDNSAVQISSPNPYRSLGDALEKWRERVKVSADPEDPHLEAVNDIEDEDADEYRYVTEAEKSTSQALGSATSDQTGKPFEDNKSDPDRSHIRKNEDNDVMDAREENSDPQHIKASESSMVKKTIEEMRGAAVVRNDAMLEEIGHGNGNNLSEDVVTFRSSFMNGNAIPISTFDNSEVSPKDMDIEEISNDMKEKKEKAVKEWRRYELITAKLSQELAEQLRLVLEPTLASKLQGDYKTGKRINMKKVIPYIASHFRKDKIWLRRTRPNKRDYQVVVAIDDSQSMSESNCGNVAIEALVTVCRAMSQLEVGQLAVASFGQTGNIKLLHDFGQPFTGEAGVKMLSSLTFKQENTIVDEPVVDLLKYLNNMLDTAAAKARMPSGLNPLHQLILIIADGKFHEKENLKRHIRDLLSRRRMVAFIVMDSAQESIMDLMEASYESNNLSFTKYLNSFPFPYYIILNNINALPRTLADLLRQWFELMQSTSE